MIGRSGGGGLGGAPGGVILGHFGGVLGSGGGFLPKTLGLGILNLSGHPWPKLPPRSPLTPPKPPQKGPKPPQNGPEAKPRQNRDKNGRAAGRSSRSTPLSPETPVGPWVCARLQGFSPHRPHFMRGRCNATPGPLVGPRVASPRIADDLPGST